VNAPCGAGGIAGALLAHGSGQGRPVENLRPPTSRGGPDSYSPTTCRSVRAAIARSYWAGRRRRRARTSGSS
jgi:hypothetical protein